MSRVGDPFVGCLIHGCIIQGGGMGVVSAPSEYCRPGFIVVVSLSSSFILFFVLFYFIFYLIIPPLPSDF